MGYELHITRREEWSDTDSEGITLEEWLQYVVEDKELELTNGFESKIGTEITKTEIPGFCYWNAYPQELEPGYRPWLCYRDGGIDTKNPDYPTIRKMIQIATALNAKVQGDDGELYTLESVNEMERFEQETTNKKKTTIRIAKPWWKFW